MRRFLLLFMAVMAAVSVNAHAYTIEEFDLSDTVKPSEWAEPEVSKAGKNNLLTEDEYFYRAYITREQFAELIVTCVEQLTGSDIKPNGSHKFTDTDNNVIEKAYAAGIVNGVSETTFAPENNITRQEIACMMHRAINYVGGVNGKSYLTNNTSLTGYSDSADVADWARESAAVLVNNGIINGTSDTTLSPLANTTVEQAIALDVRIYELMK